jgi:hypothetical protein
MMGWKSFLPSEEAVKASVHLALRMELLKATKDSFARDLHRVEGQEPRSLRLFDFQVTARLTDICGCSLYTTASCCCPRRQPDLSTIHHASGSSRWCLNILQDLRLFAKHLGEDLKENRCSKWRWVLSLHQQVDPAAEHPMQK